MNLYDENFKYQKSIKVMFDNKEYTLYECQALEVIYDKKNTIIGHCELNKKNLKQIINDNDIISWKLKDKSERILKSYQLFFVPYNVNISFIYGKDIKYNSHIYYKYTYDFSKKKEKKKENIFKLLINNIFKKIRIIK